MPADLIFRGGRIWTLDPARPEAEAVATRGDRIVAVGDEREVLALQGPATEIVELGDRMLLPGFIDAHTHFGNAAAWVSRVGLYEVMSVSKEIQSKALERRSAEELREIAVREGMRRLRDDGLEKARQGLTSVAEVLRVVGSS